MTTNANHFLQNAWYCASWSDEDRIGGVIDVNAGYQMITDNLMDLSHVEFVHKGGLGTDSITRGELEVLQDGTTV